MFAHSHETIHFHLYSRRSAITMKQTQLGEGKKENNRARAHTMESPKDNQYQFFALDNYIIYVSLFHIRLDGGRKADFFAVLNHFPINDP